MHITGHADGPPVRPGLGMTDMSKGLYAHGAILAALYARHRTGRGQKIEASLFETQLSLLINVGNAWLNMGQEGKRYGAAHPSIVPYNTYQTKNGEYLALAANTDRQYQILCERLGKMELARDERFKTNQLRVENREVVDGMLDDTFKTKTIEEWLVVLDGSRLAHGPVNSIQKAFEHPQTQARHMVQSLACDELVGGELKAIGVPVKFSETQGSNRSGPPLLGQHTGEVLGGMGYTDDEIARLREQDVI